MATDAIVILEQLRCVRLLNTESRTEPYIWPALIRVDDNTLATPELLSLISPALGNARVVIKDSMRAGETAAIPASVGILRTRMDDNLNVHRLILVVALLENDETPEHAMQDGFRAFNSELRAAITEKLFDLANADEDEEQQIIDEIKKRVESRVKSAIKNGLTAWEKVKVFAGTLNLDDPNGSDFVSFGKTVLAPAPIHLSFEARGKILGVIETLSQYEIQGQLQLRRVTIDLCQAQVNAVNEAQAVVNAIENEISELQAELQGGGEGPTLPKAFIIAEIKRLRTEELGPAMAALEEARRALQACRNRRPPVADPGAVLTTGVLDAGVDQVILLDTAGDGHDVALRDDTALSSGLSDQDY